MMKKIRKKIRAILSPFKGKVTYMPNDPDSMKMFNLKEDDSMTLQQCVGISQERSEEILNMFFEQVKKDKNDSCFESMIKVSQYCTHPNELGFLAFVAGKHCGMTCTPNPFAAIMGAMRGR